MTIDEVIGVTGRATIEAVLMLSVRELGGPQEAAFQGH